MQFRVLFVVVAFQAIVACYGDCPDFSKYALKYFDVKQIFGTWYQQYYKGGLSYDCQKADYGLDAVTGKVTVRNTGKGPLGVKVSVSGTATLKQPGILTVTLDTAFGAKTAELFVLATNGKYIILYSCVRVLFVDVQVYYFLTKEQNPVGESKKAFETWLLQTLYDLKYKTKIDNCPEYKDLKSTPQTNC